jgi:hypothetical protein
VVGEDAFIDVAWKRAFDSGPQIITKRGVEVVIIISCAEYQKMLASRGSLSTFFRDSPLVGVDLDLDRDISNVREDIEL